MGGLGMWGPVVTAGNASNLSGKWSLLYKQDGSGEPGQRQLRVQVEPLPSPRCLPLSHSSKNGFIMFIYVMCVHQPCCTGGGQRTNYRASFFLPITRVPGIQLPRIVNEQPYQQRHLPCPLLLLLVQHMLKAIQCVKTCAKLQDYRVDGADATSEVAHSRVCGH